MSWILSTAVNDSETLLLKKPKTQNHHVQKL